MLHVMLRLPLAKAQCPRCLPPHTTGKVAMNMPEPKFLTARKLKGGSGDLYVANFEDEWFVIQLSQADPVTMEEGPEQVGRARARKNSRSISPSSPASGSPEAPKPRGNRSSLTDAERSLVLELCRNKTKLSDVRKKIPSLTAAVWRRTLDTVKGESLASQKPKAPRAPKAPKAPKKSLQ